MREKTYTSDIFACILGMPIGAGLLIGILELFGNSPQAIHDRIYDEAIKAGAAVRVVNQETGEVTIEWRVCD